ncbi:presenilins-associated rhomboid-like protein, mitochondrial isoform X2 [Anguilla anguilla]|uniref:presenilins-associated rhomboid-like protein, mitochondrial isoform X2 n=1 Tax=Anguilla anguilla TaxID=7936 RepID=UPI0015ACA891|nr:presenilins-associated rhomboid-like protein, mitochondrial isoform X2 [Anguilla anguilla]
MAWRGCFLRWTKGDMLISTTRGNRSPFYCEQTRGFRKAPKKTEVKKEDVEDARLKQSELIEGGTPKKGVEPPVLPSPPRSFGRLVKPLVFTLGFTGCSFGTAAIWQYESVKSRVQSYVDEARAEWLEKLHPQKQDGAQNQNEDDTAHWHRWWSRLSDFQKQAIVVLFQVNQWWENLTQGQRTVSGIIVVNVLVFCCWRIPPLQRTMVKYFTSDPASSEGTVPSHDPLHLQPLLLPPHGGQHVCAVELLLQHRVSARPGAVHGGLPVCRCGFHARQLRGEDGLRTLRPFPRGVRCNNGSSGRCLYEDARSQAGHHLPAHVHLQCRQRFKSYCCYGYSWRGFGMEDF